MRTVYHSLIVLTTGLAVAAGFCPPVSSTPSFLSILYLSAEPPEDYRNVQTAFLSNFLPKQDRLNANQQRVENEINFEIPKTPILDIERLARILDAELYEKQWFVTGNVVPQYFSNDFSFQDPDVQVNGIQEYARGVAKIFDETCVADILSTVVSSSNTITCTWRLSGRVNIGPGLTIKPYIVYTDFTVDTNTGLIVFQEDRFDIPGWDILLSSLFPFLIGKVTAPAAPQPPPRDPPPTLPFANNNNPLEAFQKMFQSPQSNK